MKIQHLIVDSGGFINNAPIHDIAEKVYTLPDVVSEIKDKATKQRLQVLPYQLHMVEPSPEDICLVTEFSKKTGDYPSLSATDIRLLALTVHLQSQYGTPVKSELLQDKQQWKVEDKFSMGQQRMVGFYNPSKRSNNTNTQQEDNEIPVETENGEEQDDINDDSKDDGTWIGPESLSSALQQMGALTVEENEISVGCITTDFAMQNVLLHLNLSVISVQGFLIREAKTFILRCHSCFNVTSIMTKKFCPRCGNQTLKRVVVSVGKDGQRKLHINFRRPINIKGTNQSLPMPRGGKHGTDPIVCEDQPCAQNRPKKGSFAKVNPLDPDYEALSSPFALHDVHSRAAQLRSRVNKRNRK